MSSPRARGAHIYNSILQAGEVIEVGILAESICCAVQLRLRERAEFHHEMLSPPGADGLACRRFQLRRTWSRSKQSQEPTRPVAWASSLPLRTRCNNASSDSACITGNSSVREG
jgi:hypothetical protein